MITIPNTNYKADNVSLAQILNSTTKVNMLTVCKKFDLYVSPNLKKDETARRIAREVIDNPIEILSRLNKSELQIVDEFVKGNDDTYVVRKQRKTYYILQKYYLVLTYRDDKKRRVAHADAEGSPRLPCLQPPLLSRLCDEGSQSPIRQGFEDDEHVAKTVWRR